MKPAGRGETRWAVVDRLFEEALDLPPAQRDAYVARRCVDDHELREAVLALLRAERASQGMFEAPPGEQVLAALDSTPHGHAEQPDRIDRWRILRELGRGGMGTVYLGERVDDFEQRVAIKVLRRGLDTDDVVGRFLAERRILAGFSHPNIARLFDGGATSDGRPYLVMEWVAGQPITTWCDERGESIASRLGRFLDVAEAVRAAHASLIVHRDLKPSNILVTDAGVVKLLDFGIAKILGEESGDRTRTGLHLMTPQYASPEQAEGAPVTTASDVYQLGLLLFQLLCGARPGDRIPADAYDRREELRPSALVDAEAAHARGTTPDRLRRRLRGDLDTIVRKALRADPAARYGSAEALAADVRRHLDGLPVLARPATHRYRLRKFLRRHRWVAPAVGAVLLFGTVYGTTLVRHADAMEAERNVARAEAERAAEVRDFMVEMFRSADPYAPADPAAGRSISVVEALDIGVARARADLAGRPALRASLFDAIAAMYESLGQEDRAVPLRQETLALHARLDGDASRAVRNDLGRLGRALADLGMEDSARVVLERRIALVLDAPDAGPREEAAARLGLATMLGAQRQPEALARQLDRVLALADSGRVADEDLIEAWRLRAMVSTMRGDPVGAEAAARRGLALAQKVHGDSGTVTAFLHVTLASALNRDTDPRRLADAAAHFEAAIPIMERRLGADHGLTLNALNNLGVLKQSLGDYEAALALQRQVLAGRLRVHGETHRLVASSHQNIGVLLARLGRSDEAIAAHETALAGYRAAEPQETYLFALPLLSIAQIRLDTGAPAAAERSATEALQILGRTLPPDHPVAAVARCRIGRARMDLGRLEAAEPLLVAAGGILERDLSLTEYRAECLEALADLYDRTGRPEAAATARGRMEPARDPG